MGMRFSNWLICLGEHTQLGVSGFTPRKMMHPRYKVSGTRVAKEFAQREGVDYGEAPVVRHTGIRVLLSLVAYKLEQGWHFFTEIWKKRYTGGSQKHSR